jgi:hypothetical protein
VFTYIDVTKEVTNMDFCFDTVKVISLSNLAEAFDYAYDEDDRDNAMLGPSLLFEIATEIASIDVDSTHCGTSVGLLWFIERMKENDVCEFVEEREGYSSSNWQRAWEKLRKKYYSVDPRDLCWVQVYD